MVEWAYSIIQYKKEAGFITIRWDPSFCLYPYHLSFFLLKSTL